MSSPTRLILARHGETEFNTKGIIAGRQPGVYLSERGIKDCEALRDSLAHIEFAAFYSSPLERAIQTAEIVSQPRNLPIIPVPGVIEIKMDAWENQRRDWLYKHDKPWQDYHRNPVGVQIPRGEKIEDVAERCWAAVCELRDRHPGETFFLATHGECVRVILCKATGLPLSQIFHLIVDTASVAQIEFGATHPRLIRHNWRAAQGKLPLASSFNE